MVLFDFIYADVYVFWCFSLSLALALIFPSGKYNQPHRKFAIFSQNVATAVAKLVMVVGGGLVNLHLIECCLGGKSFVQIDLIKCENWTRIEEG